MSLSENQRGEKFCRNSNIHGRQSEFTDTLSIGGVKGEKGTMLRFLKLAALQAGISYGW